MIYVTKRRHEKEREDSFFDLLKKDLSKPVTEKEMTHLKWSKVGSSTTRTRMMEEPTAEMLELIDVDWMINELESFNERYSTIISTDKGKLYNSFKIPKKSGGFRQIDAPDYELKKAQTELRKILMDKFGLLWHTADYAYIEKRNTLKCVEKHKRFKSNWFLKVDISGFFPSTTKEFTMRTLAQIFPLSEMMKSERGRKAMDTALEVAFLNGGLPQGSTVSPTLVSILSIPLSYRLSKEFSDMKMVYTKYADDIYVSAENIFPPMKAVGVIRKALHELNTPWYIKDEKTHYGNKNGRNWMLGLMLNKDSNITIGHKKKQILKAMMANICMDYKNKKTIHAKTVEKCVGLLSYYRTIEPEYIKSLCAGYRNKFRVDIMDIYGVMNKTCTRDIIKIIR